MKSLIWLSLSKTYLGKIVVQNISLTFNNDVSDAMLWKEGKGV